MLEVIDVILGPVSDLRAEICLRPDGAFEVQIQQWHQEWVPDVGAVGDPFWMDVTEGKTICATREIAEREARSILYGARG